MDDKMKEFLKAVEEGNVKMANEAPVIADDGDTSMFAERCEHTYAKCVTIGLQDGGGFSSMFVTEDQWGKIKEHIDALFTQLEQ